MIACKTNGSVSLFEPPAHAAHWYALRHFSTISRTNDSPQTFILAGTVGDRNAGFPAEQIPVYFGSSLQAPRLAAVTDSQGQFSFRVVLKQDSRGGPLKMLSVTNADIYIGERTIYSSDSFDSNRNLSSGLVRKYSLSELYAPEKELVQTNRVPDQH